jgi:hypothetical protein
MGHVAVSVIAPEGEEWDDAVLVEYPSRKAFLDMLALPDYQAAVFHRTAALDDSRLIATRVDGRARRAPDGIAPPAGEDRMPKMLSAAKKEGP